MTDDSNRNNGLQFLAELEATIDARMESRPVDSYVAGLVARGDQRIAQKLGEEAVELALAAACGDREEQLEEAADLVFHLLVLLRAKGIRLADVSDVLEARSSGARAPSRQARR